VAKVAWKPAAVPAPAPKQLSPMPSLDVKPASTPEASAPAFTRSYTPLFSLRVPHLAEDDTSSSDSSSSSDEEVLPPGPKLGMKPSQQMARPSDTKTPQQTLQSTAGKSQVHRQVSPLPIPSDAKYVKAESTAEGNDDEESEWAGIEDHSMGAANSITRSSFNSDSDKSNTSDSEGSEVETSPVRPKHISETYFPSSSEEEYDSDEAGELSHVESQKQVANPYVDESASESENDSGSGSETDSDASSIKQTAVGMDSDSDADSEDNGSQVARRTALPLSAVKPFSVQANASAAVHSRLAYLNNDSNPLSQMVPSRDRVQSKTTAPQIQQTQTKHGVQPVLDVASTSGDSAESDGSEEEEHFFQPAQTTPKGHISETYFHSEESGDEFFKAVERQESSRPQQAAIGMVESSSDDDSDDDMPDAPPYSIAPNYVPRAVDSADSDSDEDSGQVDEESDSDSSEDSDTDISSDGTDSTDAVQLLQRAQPAAIPVHKPANTARKARSVVAGQPATASRKIAVHAVDTTKLDEVTGSTMDGVKVQMQNLFNWYG
jgi:hypothetical protein